VIFRSPLPDAQIPVQPLTDFVLGAAARLGSKPAFIDAATGDTLTFDALLERIHRTAAGLVAHGFVRGDVLAIFSPNLPDYAVACHAVAVLGGAAATINPLYTAEELLYQLQDSKAKYLLTIAPLLERVREPAARAGIREIFVFGEAPAGASAFAELQRHGSAIPKISIDPKNDLVALPYSSGTTGRSKGVMLTHHSLAANLVQARPNGMMNEDDVVLGVLPFFHIYGQVLIMNLGLYVGATVVTMQRFELEPFLKILQDHKISVAPLVPPIVLALAKHPAVANYNLSALRRILTGAAPVAESTMRACMQRLNCRVMQGYGMTEASGATHMHAHDTPSEKLASVGTCVRNSETMIAEVATGKALGPNQQGEVWTRGPNIMRGYLNRPEETAAAVDRDGWYRTGDIGYMDTDGYLYIVDRLKELIKYSAYQVAPAELEAVLVAHPAVADAAVIPSPDEEHGEVPKAFVVKKSEVSAEQLMAYVAERVAPYKKIRLLEFVDQIPKSPSGKILRRVLVEKERAAVKGSP
jgi:acyl-CoA synthetase (AMP-forming)/AMP-acid ligase II